MTTVDHFHSLDRARDLSALPALLTAVVLVVVMGGAALLAPANDTAPINWHGNAATATR